jgi:hypothetical protein
MRESGSNYVNPDTKPEDLPVLRELEYPTPGTIKRKATAFTEPSEEEQEELKEQRKETSCTCLGQKAQPV